jgi:hypothetical protein
MLYFTRTVTTALGGQFVELAISESADRLERLTTQGFEECSLAAFREAWRKKDAEAFERLRAAVVTAQPPAEYTGEPVK